ncbi:hypothetical protein J6590_080696 [Homalodisca vitripennis]|nr:hypothetical protein J6590_080696 [Homalodisca vitripennis]
MAVLITDTKKSVEYEMMLQLPSLKCLRRMFKNATSLGSSSSHEDWVSVLHQTRQGSGQCVAKWSDMLEMVAARVAKYHDLPDGGGYIHVPVGQD